jgi:hypothetical protein
VTSREIPNFSWQNAMRTPHGPPQMRESNALLRRDLLTVTQPLEVRSLGRLP